MQDENWKPISLKGYGEHPCLLLFASRDSEPRQILNNTRACWSCSSGARSPYAATGGRSGLTFESACRRGGCWRKRSGGSHPPGPLRLSAPVPVLGKCPTRRQSCVRIQLASHTAPVQCCKFRDQ